MAKLPDKQEFLNYDYAMPAKGWMDEPVEFKKGMYCYGVKPDKLEIVGMPNAHKWSPTDEDWNLPENWKEIILDGMQDLRRQIGRASCRERV